MDKKILKDEALSLPIMYSEGDCESISVKQYGTDYRTYTNFVIPTRSEKPTEDGFCKILKGHFSISKNISGRELQVVSDMIRENGIEWHEIGEEEKKSPLDFAKIYGTNDTEYSYEMSIFRRIEHILDTDNDELNKKINKPTCYFEVAPTDEVSSVGNSTSGVDKT